MSGMTLCSLSCFEKMGDSQGIKLIQWGSTGQTYSENEPALRDYCLRKSCSFSGEIEKYVINKLGRLPGRKGK